MTSLQVPDEELEKLKCSFCNEYLSHFPVHIYPNSEDITCGRCPILQDQNPVKEVGYELIAKYLLFPCRYHQHGCQNRISADEMAHHEKSCAFRQYFCPSTPLSSCPWQGILDELYPHYKELHEVFILTSSQFEIDLLNEYEDNYLLFQDQHLFIVHIKNEPNNCALWCSVNCIGQPSTADKFFYNITLTTPQETDTVEFDKKKVELNNSMCLNKTKATFIDCNVARNSLLDPCAIFCKLNISPNAEDAGNSLKTNNTDVTRRRKSIDEARLSEIECPVCNEYMVPPIFQCSAGHSICSACKPKVKECPTCRNPIGQTRNFAMEKMSALINYYCKYDEYGCTFISGSNQIREHEASCECGPQKCLVSNFIKCGWIGGKNDIVNHFRNKHINLIMDLKDLCWTKKSQSDYELFIILFDDNIFRYNFKFHFNSLHWTVQACGAATVAEKYAFELKFIDNNKTNCKLYLKYNCVSFTDNDIFGSSNSTVKMPLFLVSHLMQNNQLHYKFRIIKK